MNWLNINVATLRSAEYIGSEPIARATWLNVTGWCCMQENGGRIANARGWKDRQWQQICGVTVEEVNASSPLLAWDGDDLIVWNYPVEKEHEVAAKREGGRRGGLRSGASRREAMLEGEVQTESKLNSNGKERKGKEGERNTILAPAEAVAEGKPRDLIFEALCSATGTDARSLTKPGRGALNAALRDIRAASPEVTPDEIKRRAGRYSRKFPSAALTAPALAKHWAACAAPPADDWTRQQLKNAATATPTEFAHSLLADLPDVRAKFDIK